MSAVKCLDLTLPTPAANLACDEALLDACEDGPGDQVLRFWESPVCFVVVGYSNRVTEEVNKVACDREQVGIYRRCSGGGTVVQGPGCLNYSLILTIDDDGPLRNITAANCHIMGRHKTVLTELLGCPVSIQGHTDLACDNLKFSGNAQRRKRRALLFHGTFLLGFDFALVEKFLRMPSKQPEYRAGRSHTEFLMNLPLSHAQLKEALRQAWSAADNLETNPDFQKLVEEKYSRDDWNLKL